jgi:hypothetical protein
MSAQQQSIRWLPGCHSVVRPLRCFWRWRAQECFPSLDSARISGAKVSRLAFSISRFARLRRA